MSRSKAIRDVTTGVAVFAIAREIFVIFNRFNLELI